MKYLATRHFSTPIPTASTSRRNPKDFSLWTACFPGQTHDSRISTRLHLISKDKYIKSQGNSPLRVLLIQDNGIVPRTLNLLTSIYFLFWPCRNAKWRYLAFFVFFHHETLQCTIHRPHGPSTKPWPKVSMDRVPHYRLLRHWQHAFRLRSGSHGWILDFGPV
jgi:hypothetical protein